MAYKKDPGIYLIINKINKKVYVGSSNCIQRRWMEHKSTLNRNVHGNEYLQNAWNKYGSENFEIIVLEQCSEDILVDREGYWTNFYDAFDRSKGYNLTDTKRRKLSSETKLKLSKSHMGKILTDETKKKLSDINKGISRPHTDESKKKISEAHKGKTFSDVHLANLSKAHKGKKYTEKQKEARQIMIIKGEFNKKLNYEIACEIRSRYRNENITQKQLANMYSVSSRTIFDVIHNKYHTERSK